MGPGLYDICPGIQEALQSPGLSRFAPADHSCHDHGRMVPYGRSWMPTCIPKTTCPVNNHTFDSPPAAQVPEDKVYI